MPSHNIEDRAGPSGPATPHRLLSEKERWDIVSRMTDILVAELRSRRPATQDILNKAGFPQWQIDKFFTIALGYAQIEQNDADR